MTPDGIGPEGIITFVVVAGGADGSDLEGGCEDIISKGCDGITPGGWDGITPGG